MEIRIEKLDINEYRGKEFEVTYQTDGFYDLIKKEFSFEFVYKRFYQPQTKRFRDQMCAEWLGNPSLYGAMRNKELLGFIEVNPETWNNRLRISNLCVSAPYRHLGIGTQLLNTVMKFAKGKYRQLILETQSCNEKAIQFYMKNGFELAGFDAYAYSDTDIEKHEVRMEFIYKL